MPHTLLLLWICRFLESSDSKQTQAESESESGWGNGEVRSNSGSTAPSETLLRTKQLPLWSQTRQDPIKHQNWEKGFHPAASDNPAKHILFVFLAWSEYFMSNNPNNTVNTRVVIYTYCWENVFVSQIKPGEKHRNLFVFVPTLCRFFFLSCWFTSINFVKFKFYCC